MTGRAVKALLLWTSWLLAWAGCALAHAQAPDVDFKWREADQTRHQRAFSDPRSMLQHAQADFAAAEQRQDANGQLRALLDAAVAVTWLPAADADRVLALIPAAVAKVGAAGAAGAADPGVMADVYAYQALNLVAANRLDEAGAAVASADALARALPDPGHRANVEIARGLLVLLHDDAEAALRHLTTAQEYAVHDFIRAEVLMWQAAIARRASSYSYDTLSAAWRNARQAHELVPKDVYLPFNVLSLSVLMQCESVLGEPRVAWQHAVQLATLLRRVQAEQRLPYGEMGMTRVLSQFRRQDFALAEQLGRRRVLLAWGLVATGVLACIAVTALIMLVRQRQRLSNLSSGLQSHNTALQRLSHSHTRLLAASCHDLREPAHALGIQAEMAEVSYEGAETGGTDDYLRSIHHCSTKLTDMLGELLDLTRLEGGHYVPERSAVPLDELLDELKLQFGDNAARKGLTLEVADTDLWVRSDRHLLRRILFSLVASALRHTEGGQVRVSAVRERQGGVQLRIQDGSRSMSAAHLKAMLDGSHDPGIDKPIGDDFGISLSVVRHAADLLELPLTVASQSGRGNLVTLSLEPAASMPTSPAAAEAPPSTSTAASTHLPLIAVLEDEVESRQALTVLLSHWGYAVAAAASADELRGVLQAQSSPVPALVITDLHLGGLDGVEQAAIIRSWPGCDQLAVLLITGDPDAAAAARVTSANVVVGHKPMLPRQLLASIQGALARSAAEVQVAA